MYSQDFIKNNFPVDKDGNFCPITNYIANEQFFINIFGSAYDLAITNKVSIYDSLIAVTGGSRGWDVFFDEWKLRGLLT